MSNDDMMEALRALATEKGITPETLMGALADALESAYKRLPNAYEYAWATIDPVTGDMRVTAQELDEEGEPFGPDLDVTPDKDTLGRIAAQTFKQVMMQRLRDVDREMKYEEYAGREGDIVTGIIQQTDARYTLLDLGRVEALLPQAEQVPYERPEPNSRLKAYIVEVRKTAVWSNDTNVDPVGACVGARGARVRMVVNELRGEKIDIVPFSEDLPDFVAKALQPAKVKEVRIHEDTGTAEVIVPDYQLSLAIGKEGQNARLAARLSGWRVDIKSESQLAEEEQYASDDWAQGEWVVDAASGEQVWVPAEGGETLSAEQWAAGDEPVADGEAPAVEVEAASDGDTEPADDASDEAAPSSDDVPAEASDGGEPEAEAEAEADDASDESAAPEATEQSGDGDA